MEAVDQDIVTVEQEMRTLDGVIPDVHAKDLREYCGKIEKKINGEYVRAGEKLAGLDLNKRLHVVDEMDTTVRENMGKVRIILARLRSICYWMGRKSWSRGGGQPRSCLKF